MSNILSAREFESVIAGLPSNIRLKLMSHDAALRAAKPTVVADDSDHLPTRQRIVAYLNATAGDSDTVRAKNGRKLAASVEAGEYLPADAEANAQDAA